jgi:hypothetical protein
MQVHTRSKEYLNSYLPDCYSWESFEGAGVVSRFSGEGAESGKLLCLQDLRAVGAIGTTKDFFAR